jgi:hypothetical protein
MRSVDPACGSGIFLRTVLELQCDPADDTFSAEGVKRSFLAATGIDVDPSACQATRLSLTLLHLVLTGEFPPELNVRSEEAIRYLDDHADQSFDFFVTNPPFVKWDALSAAIRQRLSSYMEEHGFGKQDLYLAFLKSAMEHAAPGGLISLVLPHSFLLSKSAEGLRRQLANDFAIRVLADLSEVPVFEQGVYVILLIAERTSDRSAPAVVVKCKEFVGAALQDALAGRARSGSGYQVFETDQQRFRRDPWHLLRAEEMDVQDSLQAHPPLEKFVDVRQGIVTGADDIFVVESASHPTLERDVWYPLLSDREMIRFLAPKQTAGLVFIPSNAHGGRLSEEEVRSGYPETWKYLSSAKDRLSDRKSVVKGSVKWWEPERPRSPALMLVPKVVTPHLVLVPRFGIDAAGKFAVSRSPYLVARSESGGEPFLSLLCAVLNSAVGHWQLASSSHKYSRGYLMLEVKTLRGIRMPEPASLPSQLTRRILRLVDSLARSPSDPSSTGELDRAVGEAFGLSHDQMSVVGVGD